MEAEGFSPCSEPALQTQVFRYRLWDVNQRSLYLRDGRLLAGHLQGANAALEEKVFWVPNRALEPARLPVILGIRRGSRCLSAESGPGGEPRLRLRDVDIRELPRAGPGAAAFTFFRSHRGGLWRFESAAHPGWFLCTEPRGHRPLALCQQRPGTAGDSPGTARGQLGTARGQESPGTTREQESPGTTRLLDFYFQLC